MSADHHVTVRPGTQRVRIHAGGTLVADTTRALVLTETGHQPVHYIPVADVRVDLLRPTQTSTHCPYKGDASYWSLTLDDGTIVDAAWGYPAPLEDAPDLTGHVAFYPDKVRVRLD